MRSRSQNPPEPKRAQPSAFVGVFVKGAFSWVETSRMSHILRVRIFGDYPSQGVWGKHGNGIQVSCSSPVLKVLPDDSCGTWADLGPNA